MANCLSWRRDAVKRELAKKASSRITEAKRIGKDLITKATRKAIILVDLSPDDKDVKKRANSLVTLAKLEARKLLRAAKEPVKSKEPVKNKQPAKTESKDTEEIKLF